MQCERTMYSIRMTASAAGGEGVWLSIRSTVSGMSHLQYDERSMQHQEGCICSTRRRLCSVKCTVSESLICSTRTGCVVGEESLQYQECNICNTLRESVQYQEKFVHCEENIVQCEEKCTV